MADKPPHRLSQMLLKIFKQYDYQTGWVLSSERFLTALLPISDIAYPNPALVSTVYLWAIRLSRSADLSTPEIEHAFFERATGNLATQEFGSQSLQRSLQAVQAEILLATYLSASGRTLEVEYHVSAAVHLALGFGMNNIAPQTVHNNVVDSAPDAIEEGERISVFWKAFCLDRMWAIHSRKPAIISLKGDSRVTITTPLPLTLEEYAQGNMTRGISESVQQLMHFLDEQEEWAPNFGYAALTVKASILCERASQCTIHTEPGEISLVILGLVGCMLTSLDEEIRLIDSMTSSFISSLSPFDVNATPVLKARFIPIYAMAYLAFIRLHECNAQRDSGSYTRCVQASRCITVLLGYFVKEDFKFFEPLSLTCFVVSSRVIMEEISRLRHLSQNTRGSEHTTQLIVLVAELDRVIHLLEELVPVYPIFASQLGSLLEMRTSIAI
ncbi:hypothetical protein M0805_009861 [Coniferiporia weirii]|nr:hypothetical protein M0805_009861 [Coniferiporia weirii]